LPVAAALVAFEADVSQCERLIANAHGSDTAGAPILPELDRKQITVAAFLNFFIAWERFLEEMVAVLLVGNPTRSGSQPVKYANPPDVQRAKAILVGANRYFDYGNQEIFRKVVRLYFDGGVPFEPHLTGITQDLADMRTIRNSCAHITSTTQTALDALAGRLLGNPQLNIEAYSLITALDPNGPSGQTIFIMYKDRLLVAAQLIADG
jgi:hypothetical protein